MDEMELEESFVEKLSKLMDEVETKPTNQQRLDPVERARRSLNGITAQPDTDRKEEIIPLAGNFTVQDHQYPNWSDLSQSSPLTKNSGEMFILKPRDIPILELESLRGIDAAARLDMFCEKVEQCSGSDETRMQIAKSRVGAELAIFVHNNVKNRTIQTWSELKEFLRSEFAFEVTIDRAWQELESLNYDWAESPQAFTHRFICKHAVIESKFPTERFPDRDKTIKRKLWYGLPAVSRQKLEGFLQEEYPLKKFLDRMERERELLEERSPAQVNVIPKQEMVSEPVAEPVPRQSKELTPKSSKNESNLNKEIWELRKKIKELERRGRKDTQARKAVTPNKQYCSFCRTNSHSLTNCWKKPPPGHCFDCLAFGCRRGNSNCPGRVSPPQKSNNQNKVKSSETANS